MLIEEGTRSSLQDDIFRLRARATYGNWTDEVYAISPDADTWFNQSEKKLSEYGSMTHSRYDWLNGSPEVALTHLALLSASLAPDARHPLPFEDRVELTQRILQEHLGCGVADVIMERFLESLTELPSDGEARQRMVRVRARAVVEWLRVKPTRVPR